LFQHADFPHKIADGRVHFLLQQLVSHSNITTP